MTTAEPERTLCYPSVGYQYFLRCLYYGLYACRAVVCFSLFLQWAYAIMSGMIGLQEAVSCDVVGNKLNWQEFLLGSHED